MKLIESNNFLVDMTVGFKTQLADINSAALVLFKNNMEAKMHTDEEIKSLINLLEELAVHLLAIADELDPLQLHLPIEDTEDEDE